MTIGLTLSFFLNIGKCVSVNYTERFKEYKQKVLRYLYIFTLGFGELITTNV